MWSASLHDISIVHIPWWIQSNNDVIVVFSSLQLKDAKLWYLKTKTLPLKIGFMFLFVLVYVLSLIQTSIYFHTTLMEKLWLHANNVVVMSFLNTKKVSHFLNRWSQHTSIVKINLISYGDTLRYYWRATITCSVAHGKNC